MAMALMRKEARIAWALLAPALVVLGVFGVFPIGYAAFVSMHRWRIKKGDFLGFDYYLRALGEVDFIGLLILSVILFLATSLIRKISLKITNKTRKCFCAKPNYSYFEQKIRILPRKKNLRYCTNINR